MAKLSKNYLIQFTYIYYSLIMLFIAIILSMALYFQFVNHELPCPLCLLQRVLYFGICFGILLNLRESNSLRYDGLIQVVTVLLLIISTRQVLLDIYPRPGHAYVGTAIFGLHMPVWSIVFSVFFLLIFAIKFCIVGNDHDVENAKLSSYPKLKLIADTLIWIIIILCAINLLSTLFQCGFSSCHTYGYRLFQNS